MQHHEIWIAALQLHLETNQKQTKGTTEFLKYNVIAFDSIALNHM